MTVTSQALLFTINIDSLYANSNTSMGLQVVKAVFHRHPDPERPDEKILQLLELCLTSNDFLFDDGGSYSWRAPPWAIGAWPHGRESFEKFIDILNNHHP